MLATNNLLLVSMANPTSGLNTSERERMYTLCAQIIAEQDSFRFLQLVQELNDLLERRQRRPDDRVREICAQALQADDDQLQPLLTQLREVLRNERERLAELPRQLPRPA